MPGPESRRSPGRPKRATLNQDKVLAKAADLIDQKGPDALTMRGLADHLGVTPMALYNHFGSKKELLHRTAEHLARRIEFTCEDPDWRERIRLCFGCLRQACLAHPGIVRLMESLDAAPLAVFRPLEITLEALKEAGLSPGNGLKAYFALANFTLGQVSYEVRGPFRSLDPSEAVRDRRLEGSRDMEAALSIEPWDFDAAFEFGISAILAGIEQISKRETAGRGV